MFCSCSLFPIDGNIVFFLGGGRGGEAKKIVTSRQLIETTFVQLFRDILNLCGLERKKNWLWTEWVDLCQDVL